MLNDCQMWILTFLANGPESSKFIFIKMPKSIRYSSVRSTHGAMRRLEDRELVRARMRNGVIVWERTAAGTKALKKASK